MKLSRLLMALAAFLLTVQVAKADGISLVGTLASPETVVTDTIDLTSSATITLQTYGFGGGVNQAGTVIAAGGFDPFVGLFAGTGPSATIVTENGNPAGTSDVLNNYAPTSLNGFSAGFGTAAENSFAGCGPAGMVTIGSGAGSSVCGDITMTVTLNPGIYTILLTDADYIPNALNGGPLGDVDDSSNFTDFTNGVFQTCNTTDDGTTTCITPTDAYALDITGLPPVTTPEPSALLLLGMGLLTLAGARKRLSQTP